MYPCLSSRIRTIDQERSQERLRVREGAVESSRVHAEVAWTRARERASRASPRGHRRGYKGIERQIRNVLS